MASAPRDGGVVRGRLDKAGRLIAADPELEALQRDAGAALGELLALPQLAAIARLAREFGTPVSRPARAASASEDIDLWVNARPVGEETELSLEQWRARPAAPSRLGRLLAREGVAGEAPARLEWSADEELKVISLSSEFAKLLGIDQSAASGMALTRLLQLEENDDGEMPVIAALATRRSFTGQRARDRANESTIVTLSGEVVQGADGDFAGFRGNALVDGMDVESAAIEDSGQAIFDQTLDDVLREPLDEIIQSAGRIVERADGPLRGDYASYGNDIAAAARHLSSVIQDMSAGGLGGVGEEAGEVQTIDLTALTAEALVLVESKAEAQQVDLRFEAEATLRALGQERAVIQILVNLIGNAIRYSHAGGAVDIFFDHGDRTASITVRDDGPGIDPADQQRIFERFERADPEQQTGTGLGLAISRRLARSMGGDIGVDSTPGLGASFTLVLPAA